MSTTLTPPQFPPPNGTRVVVRPAVGHPWAGVIAGDRPRMGGEWQVTCVGPWPDGDDVLAPHLQVGMQLGSTYAVLPRFVENDVIK